VAFSVLDNMNVPLDPPVNFAVQAGFGFTLIGMSCLRASPIRQPLTCILAVVFVTLILFGTVISQSYTFFVNYPNDKAWLKVRGRLPRARIQCSSMQMYIAFMLLVDLVSSIFACSW
jgi:hypothetical protein